MLDGDVVKKDAAAALITRHLHVPFAYEKLRDQLRNAGITLQIGKARQSDCRENAENSDDHHQFDQRKACVPVATHDPFL